MKNIRPKHHICGPSNWINDPNGLVKYKNKYHVFYQHHPHSLAWGPMHWGHAVSTDLINWEYLPIALYPGDAFDKDGCFSGSAIVVNDRLYVVYTGFIANEKEEDIIQHQCLAYSDDGITFHKLGLIIGSDLLPKEYRPNDFRDPKIFMDNGVYYILVAARRKEGYGRILLYKSLDLLKWEFVSDIFENDSKGIMIECPDYSKNLNLLLMGEQFQPNEGYIHLNVHSTRWLIGEFKNNKFIESNRGIVDYGFDFYAPQTFLDENIMIGWLNMWDRNIPSEKYGFAGMLTIPRKIKIVNNELYQTPVLPHNKVLIGENKCHYKLESKVGFYHLETNYFSNFEVEIRKGKDNVTKFYLDNGVLIFNRNNSGDIIKGIEKDDDSINGIRRMNFSYLDHHDIYIVLDEYSVELFVDGKSLSSTIYPKDNNETLDIKINATISRFYTYK